MTLPAPGAKAGRSGGQRLWAYLFALAMAPLLVLWRQDNVLFTSAGYIDPWFYVGYAKNLVEFKRDYLPMHYGGSRLAWILPCFAVHSLLPPVPAAYVLHLSVWMLAVMSLFLALRWVAGARAAFLASFLMALHSWFWYSIGWDYPDGAAMACVLLATALFIYAARSPESRGPLFLAGLAGAAALHCNLGWLGLCPLFPFSYVWFAWHWSGRPVLRSLLEAAVWSGSGAVLLTAVLGMVNLGLDGNFWFFVPSFLQGRSLASQHIRWLAGVWGKDGLNYSLWMPAATAGISLFVLIRFLAARGRTAASTPAVIFSVQVLATLIYLSYFQRTEAHGLSYSYYASDVMPFSFLLIGAAFWKKVDGLTTRSWLAICIAAAAVFAFFWYDYSGALIPHTHRALCGVLTAALLLTALCLRHPAPSSVLAIAGFAILTAGSRSFEAPNPHSLRTTYEDIMQVRARLEQVRNGRPVQFWTDPQDPNADTFRSFAATYIQGIRYPNSTSSDSPCDPAATSRVLPLVALSSRPDPEELAVRAISSCPQTRDGLAVRAEPLGTIRRDGIASHATFLSASPDPAIWRPMKLIFDSSGAASLLPAPAGDPLPLGGWRPMSRNVPLDPVKDGLLVHIPNDAYGAMFVYPVLKAPEAGRYRFSFLYQALSARLFIGIRNPGSMSWRAVASSTEPDVLFNQAAVVVDLYQGEAVELAMGETTGGDVRNPFLLLRTVTVLRRDLPR